MTEPISPMSIEGLVILIPLIGTTLATLIITVLNAIKTNQIKTKTARIEYTLDVNNRARNEKLAELKDMVNTVASTTETNKKLDDIQTSITNQSIDRQGSH